MPTFNNILLIEDDYITAIVCERVMLLAGFAKKVYSYTNVAEASAHIENASVKKEYLPGVIFLDLHLGPYSGWEFLKWYAKWSKSFTDYPPIYILSSSLDIDDMKRSSAYREVKGYIVKPVKVSDLEEIANSLAAYKTV